MMESCNADPELSNIVLVNSPIWDGHKNLNSDSEGTVFCDTSHMPALFALGMFDNDGRKS